MSLEVRWSSASSSYSQQLWVRCHVCPDFVHHGWSPAIILMVGLGLPRVTYVFWVGLAWRNKRRRGRETTACYKHRHCTCINNFWQKWLSHCISLHDIAHRIYHDNLLLLTLRVNIQTFAVLVRSPERVNHEKQIYIASGSVINTTQHKFSNQELANHLECKQQASIERKRYKKELEAWTVNSTWLKSLYNDWKFTPQSF